MFERRMKKQIIKRLEESALKKCGKKTLSQKDAEYLMKVYRVLDNEYKGFELQRFYSEIMKKGDNDLC